MAAEKKRKPETSAVCPVCGEDVPRGALACPECGADHNSGWREDADRYDGIDLPEEFDYEAFTRKEFGTSPKRAGIRLIWWVTAVVVLVLTLLYCFVG